MRHGFFKGPHFSGRFARGPRDGDEFGFGEHGRGHPGWGRHGGGYGRRHGGGRRPFDQGDLRLVVLGLIADKPRHGYELIKEIEDLMGGRYAPSPGVIYPLLTLLEELGQIALSSSEGPKKLYAITSEGQAHLAENKTTVDGIFARIAEVSEAFSSHRPPQVIRAIENLRTAMRLRMERGVISDDQAVQIAAVLDAAAQAIDRI